MKIRWHPDAVEDAAEIKRFIAIDSPRYARAVMVVLLHVVEFAARQPMAGRIVPELGNQNVRERIYRNYRIIYRVTERFVEVIAIRHKARELRDIGR